MQPHLQKLRLLPRRVWASVLLLTVLLIPVVYIQNRLANPVIPVASPTVNIAALQNTTDQEPGDLRRIGQLAGVSQVDYAMQLVSLDDAPLANLPAATPLPAALRAEPSPQATPTLILALLSDGEASKNQPSATGPTRRPTPTPTSVFIFHEIERNESVIAIAAKYGITTEELVATNDLRDPNSLKPGQMLLIPPEDESYKGKIALHEAKKGDTLLGIAAKYGSSVLAIQVVNPWLADDSHIKAGETVAVPVLFKDPNLIYARYVDSEETTSYEVQPGDIPLTIASAHNLPVEILLSANDIADPTLLQIGQRLVIPPADGITLGFPVVLHELVENDTLTGLATRYGSSVKDILAVNTDLDPSDLQVGQLVAVPVIFQPPRPTPAPSAPSAPRPTPGPPPSNEADLVRQVVDRVNAERVAVGLTAHQFDAELTAAALGHAQDMYVRDFFSHVNPSGESLRDRLAEYGFNRWSSVGENIQRNTRPRNQTVDTALTWFMNSRPHRNNILHPKHTRIGVAVVEGPPGWFTFTLNFAE